MLLFFPRSQDMLNVFTVILPIPSKPATAASLWKEVMDLVVKAIEDGVGRGWWKDTWG